MPKRSSDVVQQALQRHKRGDLAGAEAGYRDALALDPDDADAHYLLGVLLQSRAGLAASRVHLERAIAARPGFRQAILQLALAEHGAGEREAALVRLFDAVHADGQRATVSAANDDAVSAELRRVLAAMLEGVSLGSGNEVVREVLRRLITDPRLSSAQLTPAVIGLVMASDAFGRVERALPDVGGAGDALAALMHDDLLLHALPSLVVTDERLERVLTALRRWLAESACGDGRLTGFASALARAAWNGEYAWAQVEPAPDSDAADEPSLLVHAMYRSLATRADAAALAERPLETWSEQLRPLVQAQLVDRSIEHALARSARHLTGDAHDAGAVAVRAMYEANPYPRWITAPTPSPLELSHFVSTLRGDRAPLASREILVAGCGTGQQSLHLARTFPEASLLAFDLSLASVGYAMRRTRELGVTNVEYALGDITQLEGLDGRFAIVSCSGVLHHLADPMTAWRRLVATVAPGGVMKIGLYSALARTGIAEAQRFVRDRGFEANEAGIREARAAILALPPDHPARAASGFADFHTVSGFRDLLMHVQERSYRLPELRDALRTLGLAFLGFQLAPAVLAAFRARHGDDAQRDLDAWDAFERAHPTTFAGMYQFWCAPA